MGVVTIGNVCDACGEPNPARSAFCSNCGTYLGWEAETTGRHQQVGSSPTERAGPITSETEPAAVQEVSTPRQSESGNPPQVPTPRRQPSPVTDGPASTATIPVTSPTEPPCPACGRLNPRSRRFCAKCGQPLQSRAVAWRARQPEQRQSWWDRFRDPSARAYRRSLPARYRWRRVLIGVVALACVVALLTVLGRNPVGWIKQRWYDLRDTTVPVDITGVVPEPAESVADGYSTEFLADKSEADAWATAWSQETQPATECGGAAGVGKVVLSLSQPTRIRGMAIVAGLAADHQDRQRQFRPQRVDIVFDGGCTSVNLANEVGRQNTEFDTDVPVSQLTLAIASAYPPPRAEGALHLVAISEVTLLARPG
jgi:hypothetical protein